MGIVSIKGSKTVRNFNEELMNAVDRQPIATSIDASSMQNYVGGIYPAWKCSEENTN